MGSWSKIISQTEQELKDVLTENNFNQKTEATNWGVRTGIFDLFAGDFEQPWLYRLWKMKLGERAETLTYRTPNGGTRPLYFTEETSQSQGNPYKTDLHFELLTKTYAAIGGSAESLDGSMQNYEPIINKIIIRDNKIIEDTKKFMEQVLKLSPFLNYKCIREHIGKWIILDHPQRLALVTFMVKNSWQDQDIHNYFQDVRDKRGKDYKHGVTQKQIDSTRQFVENGGQPNPCTAKENKETGKKSIPLYSIYSFDSAQCGGCPRKKQRQEKANQKESLPEQVMGLVLEQDIELFCDHLGEPHIKIKKVENSDAYDTNDTNSLVVAKNSDFYNMEGKKAKNKEICVTSVISVINYNQIYPVNSSLVKNWIADLSYTNLKKIATRDTISSCLSIMSAKSRAGEIKTLYNRVAPDGEGGIWIDTADRYNRAIHVTKNGWNIVDQPPSIFRRYPHQLPLVTPSREGNIAHWLKYITLNTVDEQLLWILSNLSYVIPEIPHPITVLYGGQGATKTAACRSVVQVLDPSNDEHLFLHSKEKVNDLIQNLDHHYISFFDNVSEVTDTHSDIFCRAVTGAGMNQRKLYTDNESVIRRFQRCIIMNGINPPTGKPDFVDRSSILEVQPMSFSKRKTDREVKNMLETNIPLILGGVLDLMVKALGFYDESEYKKLPRMADFTLWACAFTKAMGLDPKDFLKSYNNHLIYQEKDTIKSHQIGEIFISWLEDWASVTNVAKKYSATDLYSELHNYAKTNNISVSKDNFPPNSTQLGRRLNEIKTILPSFGYTLSNKRSASKREWVITPVSTASLKNFIDSPNNDVNWGFSDLYGFLLYGSKEVEAI